MSKNSSSPIFRVGFVDHDLNNFHANVYLKAFHQDLADRHARVAGCTAQHAEAGRRWAEEAGVPYFDDPAELAEAVDAFIVLAPSNPEEHLPLCEQVLPFGKPTFVDKTFAPDEATARHIFELSDRYAAAVQSSSALRYTNVQAKAAELASENLRHMVAWGGGRSFDEYAIHPLEIVVSCLGADAVRVARRGQGNHSQLLIDFTNGRTAVVNVYTNATTPFAASLSSDEQTQYVAVDTSRLFIDAASNILTFLEAGEEYVDRRETLTIMRILDAARRSETEGQFVTLDGSDASAMHA